MAKSVIIIGLVLLVTFIQLTEQRRMRRPWQRTLTSDSSNTTDGCPSFRCWKNCSYGYMKDSKGCNLCACARDPSAGPCPEIECPDRKSCPFGYKTDEKRCTTCECKTKEEVCGQMRCTMACPNGLMTDRRGCEVCRCKRSENARRTSCTRRRVTCRNECAFGRATDRAGCPLCTCNPRPVQPDKRPSETNCTDGRPVATCRMHCEHGFKRDTAGCPVCECADPPKVSLLPAGVKTDCIPRRCRMSCASGYQVDSRGCEMCVCKPPSHRVEHHGRGEQCPAATCRMHCPDGFAKDDKGCEVCRCVEAEAVSLPASTVPSVDCSRRPTCRMYCERGFQKGSDGCDVCKCA